jgi:hypothetical protein
MKIIISGGTGLIGSALADNLARDGHQVILLSRNPQAQAEKLPAGVEIVAWDGRSSAGWGQMVDGADAVVNLAGESIAGDSMAALIFKRWTPERKQRLRTSRLDAGKAMVEAIEKAKVKPRVLVQASAVGYYGSRGDEVLTEESRLGDDFLALICKDWEASTAPVESMGVRRVIIRSPGVVVSTKGGAFPFMLLPFKLFLGGRLGSGKQWFSWVHIKDEVKAIRFLIERPDATGAFNLAAPQATTNGEFSKILGKVMGRPSIIPVPAFALKLLFGSKAAILLVSTRQVPEKLNKLGFVFDFPTAEQTIADVLGKK